MRLSILLLLSCLFFGSCSVQEISYTPPVFNKEYQIESKIINDNFLFRHANQILISDSLLIVNNMSEKENICIFNRYDGTLINASGETGNGPNELITPICYSIDRKNNYLYINDYGKRCILKYDLNQSLQNPLSYSNIKLADEINERNRFLFLKDSLFVTDGFFDRIAIVSHSRLISKITDCPINQKFESSDDWNKFMYSYSCITASPDGNKVASASIIGGILEIYNTKSKQIKLTKTKYFYEPIFDKKGPMFNLNQETIYGFCHLSATNNYLYATAHGKANPTAMPNTIWKFDWEGNPIASYKSDYHIGAFTVDEKNNLVYAIIYNQEGEQVLATMDLLSAK